MSRAIRSIHEHFVMAALVRSGLLVFFGLGLVYLFWPDLDGLNWHGLIGEIARYPAHVWAISACLIALSVAAVASYDLHALRALGFVAPRSRALLSGFLATAIVQFVGFGLITGALIRWRILGGTEFSLKQAAGLTITVSFGFFASAIVWCLVFAALARLGWGVIPISLFLGWIIVTLLAWQGRSFTVFGRKFPLPGLATLCAFFSLSLIDLVAAGCAFWMFLPGDSVDLFPFLAGFPVALMAGLLSAIPGAAGSMDLVMLALFPEVTVDAMFSAMMAFRITGIAFPALLAFAVLAFCEFGGFANPRDVLQRTMPATGRDAPPILRAFQSHGGTLRMAETGHCRTGLGPITGSPRVIGSFLDEARKRGLVPVHYAADHAAADFGKSNGYCVFPCGAEAVLDPVTFSLAGRARAGLRRKLKSAEKAGLTFAEVQADALPIKDLEAIAADWGRSKGSDRGFVMSRFCPVTLSGARWFVGYQNGRAIGFVTFRVENARWTLDLIRHFSDAPAGLIYGLVVEAITIARAENATLFSLASVPFAVVDEQTGWKGLMCRSIFKHCNRFHRAQGLWQFKQSFRPDWQQRYLIARNTPSALIGAIEVLRNCIATR